MIVRGLQCCFQTSCCLSSLLAWMALAYVLLHFSNVPGHLSQCIHDALSCTFMYSFQDKHLLCLQLEGYKYAGNDQKKDIRMRFFHTHQNIHPNHVFQPVVSPPTVDDRKPRVNWVDFHTVMPVDSMDTNHSGRLEALAGLWRTSGLATLPFIPSITQSRIHSCIHSSIQPFSHAFSVLVDPC